jgi:hypothetical protein
MKMLTEPFHPDLGVARLRKRRLPYQVLRAGSVPRGAGSMTIMRFR